MRPDLPPFRIGIVGAGPMGSSLATLVAPIASTVLVCRDPERAAQIFDQGVVVEGLGVETAYPILVSRVEALPAVGGVDYLFIATKTTAIPGLCRQMLPVYRDLGVDGRAVRLISYQNGIESGTQIMEALPGAIVLRMVLHYGAVLDRETGITHVRMTNPPHFIGCVDEQVINETRDLAAAFSAIGFHTEYAADIDRHVWAKAILNAAMSPVAALVDTSIGETLSSPARLVVERLLAEGIAVAEAEGHKLGERFQTRALEALAKAADHLPSMVDDLRSGRESEVGQLNRQIIRHARSVDVEVPTHEVIDRLIETFDWRIYHRRPDDEPAINRRSPLGSSS
ncbi:MAG: ketopantoate reductase family protein [Phycisphaerales bacterium]